MKEPVQITREQLYREIWTTPIHQLAKKYELSDVGLAKVCERHGIPRPGRGYWARKQAGQNPGQPALPPAGEGKSTTIVFQPASSRPERSTYRPPDPPPPPPGRGDHRVPRRDRGGPREAQRRLHPRRRATSAC